MSTVLLERPEPEGAFAQFWRWWTDELRAIRPRRRRDPLLRKAVILLSDGVGFRAMVRRGTTAAVDLGRLDQPRPSRIDVKRGAANPRLVPDEQSTALAQRIEKSGLPVVLRLPASEGLVAHDELPAAAERHLHDVIGHRVDVLTPWTEEQVAYDARVDARDKATARIGVEATFAARETIEQAGAALLTFGLRPSVVDVAGSHVDELPRIDLLRGLGQQRSRWWVIVPGCLAAFLLMASAVLFYDYWQRSYLLADRHEQEQRLAERASEAEAALAERRQALADARFLDARRLERPSSLAALEIVSADLPDDAWLSRLELAGNKVTITGEAREAPKVLAVIGADARFSNAALGSSSTRGPSVAPELFGMPVDRFTLTASLAPDAMVDHAAGGPTSAPGGQSDRPAPSDEPAADGTAP